MSTVGNLRKDGVLDQIVAAGADYDLPMLLGWIANESGGRNEVDKTYGESGYFQIMPSEATDHGIDINLVRSSPAYSVEAGLKLVGYYSDLASKIGYPSLGDMHWRITKLLHSMGSGAAQKLLKAAKDAGVNTDDWDALESWALSNEESLLHLTKKSPTKWFGLVDRVMKDGKVMALGLQVAPPDAAPAVAVVADAVAENPQVAGVLVATGLGLLLWWYYRTRK